MTALVGLAEAQKSLGLQVEVLSTLRRGKTNTVVAERLRGNGIPVQLVGPGYGPLLMHPKLSSAVDLAVSRAEVVHIHGVWEEIQHQAARKSQRYKVPYIYRPCGLLTPWDMKNGHRKKTASLAWRVRDDINHAHAIHFTTQTEKDGAGNLNFVTPSIIEPNGINCEEFQPPTARGNFRRLLGIGENTILILFFSRIHPKKGLDLLIPAFSLLKENTHLDVVLAIAGPGEADYVAEIHHLVENSGIGASVFFPGMLAGQQRIEALSDADLFVLPSYQENFGNAVVEALAVGTPVIISDQVNLHETVTRGKVGGVVPTDIRRLYEEMAKWINDDQLRRDAGARARPFVAAEFDWINIAKRWTAHYDAMRSG
jgi:glycosyltransferase involved in cell wall biosynthesis